MHLEEMIDTELNELRALHFSPPVAYVYNPLEYAREAYLNYLTRYARPPKEIVLLGMNPGPWGMAQTGVPFGEVRTVKEWLRIEGHIGTPMRMHPKRPVQGFECKRSEVSGQRLWGWARKRFGTPQRFFDRFFVANYCPLLFIEANGRNRTPDNLRVADRKPLLAVCDRGLQRTVRWLNPRYVVGIGRFARTRAEIALAGYDVTVGMITHPSPANPKANRGWESLIMRELSASGIRLGA